MRMPEELESMQNHPSAVQDGSGSPEAPAPDPYRAHFVAIEQLKDAVLLHGSQSFEAGLARKRLDRTREDAITAWHAETAAA